MPGQDITRESGGNTGRLHPLKPIAVLAALLILLVPASAHAERIGTVMPAKTSLAQPRVPLPSHFEILRAECPIPDGGSCTLTDGLVSRIYLAPGAGRFARWHELGHIFDAQMLTDDLRAWFTQAFGLPSGPWERGTGLSGLDSPSEKFADAYAACALGLQPDRQWETAYDYQPTVRQHQWICHTIRTR